MWMCIQWDLRIKTTYGQSDLYSEAVLIVKHCCGVYFWPSNKWS